MKRKSIPGSALVGAVLLIAVLMLQGACSAIVRKEPPTLSHVHIGHAITAWEQAPGSQGLLTAAELYAIEARVNSDRMSAALARAEKEEAGKYLTMLAEVINPTTLSNAPKDSFGMRRLLAEALVHLKVAAEIFDASLNVRRSMTEIHVKGQEIVDRIDELEVFVETALQSDDLEVLRILADEITRLVAQVSGQSNDPSVYGIQQLREDVEAMVAREDPPYQTIDKYYLFSIGI